MFHLFITLISLATAAFLILFVLTTANELIKSSFKETLPYRSRQLLSNDELDFYRTLRTAVDGRAVILMKVNLGDIFEPTHNQQFYWNRINRKHVDFLICDPATMQPRCGIELDDESCHDATTKERDRLKNDVFEAANVPLLRIAAQPQYESLQLSVEIAPFLN